MSTRTPLRKVQVLSGDRSLVVVIPKLLEEQLGIEKGNFLKCEIENGRMILEGHDVVKLMTHPKALIYSIGLTMTMTCYPLVRLCLDSVTETLIVVILYLRIIVESGNLPATCIEGEHAMVNDHIPREIDVAKSTVQEESEGSGMTQTLPQIHNSSNLIRKVKLGPLLRHAQQWPQQALPGRRINIAQETKKPFNRCQMEPSGK